MAPAAAAWSERSRTISATPAAAARSERSRTFSESPLTHRDREREARALALAGVRLVPLLARVARVFVQGHAWSRFGAADLGDFCREYLGRSGRWLRDLAELGSGLEKLPGLEAAILGTDGGAPLGRVAARCVAKTASPETLAAWVSVARRVPVRELLESARAARRAGSARPVVEEAAGSASASRGKFEPTGVVEEEDSDELLSEVRLELPVPMDVAVDETRDLYRAVAGRESNLASFVEALVGEAFAGAHPPDASLVPVGTGQLRAVREKLLAELHAGWKDLDEPGDGPCRAGGQDESEATADAAARRATEAAFETGAQDESEATSNAAARGASETTCDAGARAERQATSSVTELDREMEQVLEQVVAMEGAVAWNVPSAVVAGWQLWDLVEIENRLEQLLGRALHQMSRHGDWSQLGFTGVGHYAEQRLGLGRRTAECRAAIVGALRNRPTIQAAYTSRAIGLESAWLLVRVLGRGPVDPQIEAAWVECARRVTVKRLRDEVRRAKWVSCGALGRKSRTVPMPREPGESGTETSASEPQDETTPTLEFLPTSAFESRVVPRTLRPVVPLPATDAEWQASLRRWPGMTRERVWRLGTHALEAPGADVFRRFRLPQDLAGHFLAAIESERRRLEEEAHREPWTGPLPHPLASPAERAAQEYAGRMRRVPAWVGLLSLLEDFARTWDDPKRIPKRRWRRIYERENYRCAAPGCTRSADIQDHHIDYRSHKGSDEPWNQIALCKFHHQQGEHGRFARVRGSAPLDLTWRLGTPDLASWWRNECRIDGNGSRRMPGRERVESLAG